MPKQKKKVVPDAKQSPETPEHVDLQTAFVLAGLDRAAQQQTASQQTAQQQAVKLPETLVQNMWPMGGVNPMHSAQMQLASFAMLSPQQQQDASSNPVNASLDAVCASIQAGQLQQQQPINLTQQHKAAGVSNAQDTAVAASALLSTAAGGHGQQASQHYAAAMHWLQHGIGSETSGAHIEAAALAAAALVPSKGSAGAAAIGNAKPTQRRRKNGAKGPPKAGMLDKKRSSMSMDICDNASGGGGGGGGKSKQTKKTKAGHLLNKKANKSEKPPTPAEAQRQQTQQQQQLNEQLQNLQQQQHTSSTNNKQPSTTKNGSSTPAAMDDSDDDLVMGPNGQPMSRRERKNTREKQRRLEVNTMFDNLMGMLDLPKDNKADKVKILQNAIDSIAALRDEAHYFRSIAPPAAAAAYTTYANAARDSSNKNSYVGGGAVVVPRSDHGGGGGGKLMHGAHTQSNVGLTPSVGRVLSNNAGHGVDRVAASGAISSNNGVFCQPSGRRLSVLSSASYSSMDESKSNGGAATPLVDETVGRGTYTA